MDCLKFIELASRAFQTQSCRLFHETEFGIDVSQLLSVRKIMPKETFDTNQYRPPQKGWGTYREAHHAFLVAGLVHAALAIEHKEKTMIANCLNGLIMAEPTPDVVG